MGVEQFMVMGLALLGKGLQAWGFFSFGLGTNILKFLAQKVQDFSWALKL